MVVNAAQLATYSQAKQNLLATGKLIAFTNKYGHRKIIVSEN